MNNNDATNLRVLTQESITDENQRAKQAQVDGIVMRPGQGREEVEGRKDGKKEGRKEDGEAGRRERERGEATKNMKRKKLSD